MQNLRVAFKLIRCHIVYLNLSIGIKSKFFEGNEESDGNPNDTFERYLHNGHTKFMHIRRTITQNTSLHLIFKYHPIINTILCVRKHRLPEAVQRISWLMALHQFRRRNEIYRQFFSL